MCHLSPPPLFELTFSRGTTKLRPSVSGTAFVPAPAPVKAPLAVAVAPPTPAPAPPLLAAPAAAPRPATAPRPGPPMPRRYLGTFLSRNSTSSRSIALLFSGRLMFRLLLPATGWPRCVPCAAPTTPDSPATTLFEVPTSKRKGDVRVERKDLRECRDYTDTLYMFVCLFNNMTVLFNKILLLGNEVIHFDAAC